MANIAQKIVVGALSASCKISPILGIGVIVLMLLCLFGWFANIFKFVFALDGGMTAMLFGRAIGFFVFPLGGLLGWL